MRNVLIEPSNSEDVLQKAFTRLLRTRRTIICATGHVHTASDCYRHFKRHSGVIYCAPTSPDLPTPLATLIQEEKAEIQSSLLGKIHRILKMLIPEQ